LNAQQEIAELKAALVAKDAQIAALMAQVAALHQAGGRAH